VNTGQLHLALATHSLGNIDSIHQAHPADTVDMAVTNDRMALLSRLLDVASLRQEVIAQNVANINTPGYRTLEVNFEQALRDHLTSSSKAPIAQVQPQVVEGQGGLERADGNNVDVDIEMARLQKNSLYFKVYLQIIASKLAQHRSAITGR
jgi:flagellar basal-body rod protein FlgB